jgi:hypothetical protein
VQLALEKLAEREPDEISPIAAVAIGAYKAVAFRVDGTVELADCENPAHSTRMAGITLSAAISGDPVRVRAGGKASFNGWNWPPGAPVFVGRNGALTDYPPETGFVQHLGFALGSDTILVALGTCVERS